MGFFCTKGQVTPKSIVRSGQNSNYSKVLCLSMLSASFIKIRLKLNKKTMLRTRSIWYFCHSRVSNSKMNSLLDNIFSIISLWEKFSSLKGKLLQSQWSDLAQNQTRPRFYGCPRYLQVQYEEYPIKNEVAIDWTFPHYKSMGANCHSRTSNSNVNIPIWPKFELGDFLPVLVTCKFVEDPIKIDRTVKYELFWHSRADNS